MCNEKNKMLARSKFFKFYYNCFKNYTNNDI